MFKLSVFFMFFTAHIFANESSSFIPYTMEENIRISLEYFSSHPEIIQQEEANLSHCKLVKQNGTDVQTPAGLMNGHFHILVVRKYSCGESFTTTRSIVGIVTVSRFLTLSVHTPNYRVIDFQQLY